MYKVTSRKHKKKGVPYDFRPRDPQTSNSAQPVNVSGPDSEEVVSSADTSTVTFPFYIFFVEFSNYLTFERHEPTLPHGNFCLCIYP